MFTLNNSVTSVKIYLEFENTSFVFDNFLLKATKFYVDNIIKSVLLANDSKLIIWFKLNRKKRNKIIIIKKKFVFLSSFIFLHLFLYFFVFNFYFRHLCFRSEKLDLKQRTVKFSKDLGFAIFFFFVFPILSASYSSPHSVNCVYLFLLQLSEKDLCGMIMCVKTYKQEINSKSRTHTHEYFQELEVI